METTQENIAKYILENIENNPSSITSMMAEEFGFSRQTAHKYITREVEKGSILKTGTGAGTKYFISGGNKIHFSLKVEEGKTEEDKVFSKYIKPMLLNISENIFSIINYTFTEILNNAIEHSGGTSVYIELKRENGKLEIEILDNGIGIFNKIQDALRLESARESILHLSKGKFTTDPDNHTGEGIFFSSRSLDSFAIFSSDLFYTFTKNDWFLSSEKPENFGKGTYVKMIIAENSQTNLKTIFDKYTNENYGFDKTIVAVSLSTDPGDPHVSRSQAKRLLLGLDKFKHVVLDFKGVKSVGQAFVDEVFRVFANKHPQIRIDFFNAEKDVEDMILRGIKERESQIKNQEE